MITNYKNLDQKKRLENKIASNAQLYKQLQDIYKEANKKRWILNEEPSEQKIPLFTRPVKPKELLDDEDIRREIIQKLQPYMLNNNNIIQFTETLQENNQLNNFNENFEFFKKNFLRGRTRLTSNEISNLWLLSKAGGSTARASNELMIRPTAPVALRELDIDNFEEQDDDNSSQVSIDEIIRFDEMKGRLTKQKNILKGVLERAGILKDIDNRASASTMKDFLRRNGYVAYYGSNLQPITESEYRNLTRTGSPTIQRQTINPNLLQDVRGSLKKTKPVEKKESPVGLFNLEDIKKARRELTKTEKQERKEEKEFRPFRGPSMEEILSQREKLKKTDFKGRGLSYVQKGGSARKFTNDKQYIKGIIRAGNNNKSILQKLYLHSK